MPSVHLVEYCADTHAWLLTATALPVADGGASFPLPAPGRYALVVADESDPPILLPAVGDALPGVPPVALPEGATRSGVVQPASISPAAIAPATVTAQGLLAIASPALLPSGTIVQAAVTETVTLASGSMASNEARSQDLIAYRAPGLAYVLPANPPAAMTTPTLSAVFPVTASLAPADLVSGTVHVDVFADRAAARGHTGGSEPVTIEAGGATLSVPGGALAEDTAITFQAAVLSAFITCRFST